MPALACRGKAITTQNASADRQFGTRRRPPAGLKATEGKTARRTVPESDAGRVRLKRFRIVSRKSAVRMLYAVMDRVRSDFERFTEEIEPRVRHVPESSNDMDIPTSRRNQ